MPFSLCYSQSHLRLPPAHDPHTRSRAPRTTGANGRRERPSKANGRAAIRRSLITLKALAYEPTGGIVAAPTTSLPEQLGGTRNWDYRYCWLRDATITLLAMMRGGYYDEARAWRAWLGRVMAGSPEQVQIMYGIAGERRLPEWIVDWLPGYRGRASRCASAMARSNQLQLDVYGEVMNALHLARVGGLQSDETAWIDPVRDAQASRNRLAGTRRRHLGSARRPPALHVLESDGVGGLRPRASSRRKSSSLPGPLDHWRDLRAQIHADVCEKSWNAPMNSFVQAYRRRCARREPAFDPAARLSSAR